MKHRGLVILAAGVGLLSAGALSQTVVYTPHAVGFVRKEFSRGQWTMCSVPLNPAQASSAATLAEILGDGLPVNTKVYFWKDNQSWEYEEFSGVEDEFGNIVNQWTPGTHQFPCGSGLFVFVPADAPESSYTIFLTGRVPAAATSPVYQVEGFTLFGYPYPVSTNLVNTVFGSHATVGDKCYIWSPSGWQYSVYSGVEDEFGNLVNQWSPDVQIVPGMALFYQAASPGVTNDVARPYSYPAE